MPRNTKKAFNNKRGGKASKPNLAVVLLIFIVIVQSFLLFKAYAPKNKPSAHKKPTAPSVTKPPVKKPLPPQTVEVPLPPTPTPGPNVRGKVVIIIDDSGYKKAPVTAWPRIDVPVTISIPTNSAL